MIDILKETFPNADEVDLKLYLKIATEFIKVYLNNDKIDNDYISDNYQVAILMIVKNIIEKKQTGQVGNIKSITQGNRAITFDRQELLTNDILDILPNPYVKFY